MLSYHAAMSWVADYRRDLARYTGRGQRPGAQQMLTQQALWALLQYRIASAVHRSSLQPALRLSLLTTLYAWRKAIEMTTGISLPHTAVIGPGLHIPHFGPVIVNKAAVIGSGCDIHQGVTIGFSDRGGRSGTPVIGDCVWIGPNAAEAGPVMVGDDAMISANSLVRLMYRRRQSSVACRPR